MCYSLYKKIIISEIKIDFINYLQFKNTYFVYFNFLKLSKMDSRLDRS